MVAVTYERKAVITANSWEKRTLMVDGSLTRILGNYWLLVLQEKNCCQAGSQDSVVSVNHIERLHVTLMQEGGGSE